MEKRIITPEELQKDLDRAYALMSEGINIDVARSLFGEVIEICQALPKQIKGDYTDIATKAYDGFDRADKRFKLTQHPIAIKQPTELSDKL